MRTNAPVGVVLWILLACAWLMVATKLHAEFLPAKLAGQIGHNAEGYALVLMVAPWIARRTRGLAPSWGVTLGISAALLLVGLVLSFGIDVTALATLDEACYGAAVLLPYIRADRPLDRRWLLIPALAVAIPVLFSPTTLGWVLAEVYGFCLVIPLYLDWIDRRVLEPEQARRRTRLLVWVAALLVIPVVVSIVRVEEPQGFVESVFRYLSRPTEAAVAGLLLTGWFSFLRPYLRR